MAVERAKLKYLFSNIKIFAISNIATKLITFLLVPLYTYCLTTNEYGVIDLLFTVSSVLFPLFTLNISESIYRFSMDKDSDTNKIMSIGIISCVLCFFASIFSIILFDFFPSYSKYKYYFLIYLNSTAVFQLFSANLKGQEKLDKFTICNISNTMFTVLLNVIFLKFLNLGIEGYFLAYSIANFISSIYAFSSGSVLFTLKNFKFDYYLCKSMLKYSIVLLPTSFLWWIIDSSDRVMISSLLGSNSNGIYAISYKIPAIIASLAGIFNQSWVFTVVKEKESKNKSEYANTIFNSVYIIMAIVALIIITFIKTFFKFYLSPDYYTAWKYVPFLLVGSLFLSFGTFFSASYNAYKDGKGMLFSSILGALVNIFLNFLLIPKFGIYGAAIATCISYISVFFYRYIDTQKYIRITFKIYDFIPLLLLLVSSILLYFDSINSQIIQIVILFFSIFCYRKKIFKIVSVILEMGKRK